MTSQILELRQILEERLVEEARRDPHYKTLIYVAAYTGLRAGELGGLQRRDVDLLRGVLHVRRALKDVNGRLDAYLDTRANLPMGQ